MRDLCLTDEKIESIVKAFWDKYSGKGLSPSEVMELHHSELWASIAQTQLDADNRQLPKIQKAAHEAGIKTVVEWIKLHWISRSYDVDGTYELLISEWEAQLRKWGI